MRVYGPWRLSLLIFGEGVLWSLSGLRAGKEGTGGLPATPTPWLFWPRPLQLREQGSSGASFIPQAHVVEGESGQRVLRVAERREELRCGKGVTTEWVLSWGKWICSQSLCLFCTQLKQGCSSLANNFKYTRSIISTETEKAFDKIQYVFLVKTVQQTRSGKKFQHNKSRVWKAYI